MRMGDPAGITVLEETDREGASSTANLVFLCIVLLRKYGRRRSALG